MADTPDTQLEPDEPTEEQSHEDAVLSMLFAKDEAQAELLRSVHPELSKDQ